MHAVPCTLHTVIPTSGCWIRKVPLCMQCHALYIQLSPLQGGWIRKVPLCMQCHALYIQLSPCVKIHISSPSANCVGP